MKCLYSVLLSAGLSLTGLALPSAPLLGYLTLGLTTLGTAAAAPQMASARIGTHDGYTRLVFDLPASSTLRSTVGPGQGGQKVLTVTLKVPLKAEQRTVSQAGVASYSAEGKTLSVYLEAGVETATAVMLPASGGQPNRLVIDVPLAGKPIAGNQTAVPEAQKAAPRTSATPVIKPASTGKAPILMVVLDAGHGGIDAGMSSRWVVEKEVTLDVALRIRRALQAHGVNVIMVRTTDTQLSVSKKVDLQARSRLASVETVNAYVSIHVNSSENSSASGIETYYFGQPMSSASRALAVRENGEGSLGEELTRQASSKAQSLVGDLLSQAKLAFSAQLARSVQSQLIAQTGAQDRGVQPEAFVVIRDPHAPAILAEIGFGSNPSEGPKLAQEGYRDRVAGAIATGILKFLKVQ